MRHLNSDNTETRTKKAFVGKVSAESSENGNNHVWLWKESLKYAGIEFISSDWKIA